MKTARTFFVLALMVRTWAVSAEAAQQHIVNPDQLTATMTQTGSLGQAIQTVKHTSSATATTQATKAEQEADSDLKTSTTTTTTKKR